MTRSPYGTHLFALAASIARGHAAALSGKPQTADCDACGRSVPAGTLRTVRVGLAFPMEGDFCERCRNGGEEGE